MTEVPMKDLLQERFGRPAFINNDVNCFVMGEYAFGKARGFRHVAALNLGTGFAAGLIIDGRLYEGPNCGAGEFGMVPYGDSILENYCSGLFFIRRGLDAGEMASRARGGDSDATALWLEFGIHVGHAIKTVLYTVDPEIILLGGSIRKAYDLFESSMWEVVGTFAFRKSLERLRFELSELEHAPLLGAASLPRGHAHSQTA
jgi:glucokinase